MAAFHLILFKLAFLVFSSSIALEIPQRKDIVRTLDLKEGTPFVLSAYSAQNPRKAVIYLRCDKKVPGSNIPMARAIILADPNFPEKIGEIVTGLIQDGTAVFAVNPKRLDGIVPEGMI